MANEFGRDHALMHEVIITGRKVGADERFWARMAHNEGLFKETVVFVMKGVFYVVAQHDLTGWICVEPVDAKDGDFEPVLQEFLHEGETYCKGEEMVKRAKEQGALTGLRNAEAMIRNQERIPVEWRKYYLVFSEVWQSPDGNRNVWYLYWNGKRWYLNYNWLSNNFNSNYRLVASRK